MGITSVAFPFIEVKIDTSGLAPVAQRSPGVIAIVGKTPGGAAGGSADPNKPYVVDGTAQAAELFAKETNGVVSPTELYRSLATAMLQDPKPSKIYGVKVAGDDYGAALSSLEAMDDVTFVALANETSVGAATGSDPATDLMALKEHVENMSSEGLRRIGVAMVDPTLEKSPDYVTEVTSAVGSLKSDSSRMVMIAARGTETDAASAAMAAIAGFEPHISMVLKKVRGVTMPKEGQYAPTEIKALSQEGLVPIIDPALIVGESLHFAEGGLYTTDANLAYIDIVRVLDDIEFRLKAGLIGLIGDARITKAGMTRLKVRTEGILGVLKRSAVIADYEVSIPVLDILSLPESTWSATDQNVVVTSRSTRSVDMFVSVTYGPAVHRLKVTLAPKF